MRPGLLLCGPVLHRVVQFYIARSGPALGGPGLGWCGLVVFAVVRSYTVWSGPISRGPALHWVFLSWVDAVWPSWMRSGLTLICPVLYFLVQPYIGWHMDLSWVDAVWFSCVGLPFFQSVWPYIG